MNEENQSPKIVAGIATILTVLLGYGFIQGKVEDPRPYSLKVSAEDPNSKGPNKVESRLWQDPFESFASETNGTASAPAETGTGIAWLDLLRTCIGGQPTATNEADDGPWNDSVCHNLESDCRVAYVGVMLEGGSYANDKEVRLRLRYAVEVALLTADMGPDDRTHILTNAIYLPKEGSAPALRSRFAYEWFRNQRSTTRFRLCVLWLNENDFADKPPMRLGGLVGHFSALTNENGNASFYVVGPRFSDTLQAFVRTPPTNSSSDFQILKAAASLGRFHILSPEATASIYVPSAGDSEGRAICADMASLLGSNVFHRWIASDQREAYLMAAELGDRLRSPPNSNNVVVVLSEQDTYYGRKLADEWIAAFVNQVCVSSNNVWQFSYLCGLDGSKPAPPKDVPAASTPEAVLETARKQQQEGERADGDAQLDYVVRLAEFLKEKDHALNEQTGGGIVAVGIAGGDAYDKLSLLHELRHRFPEAIFFTTDLDASLWTASSLKYTRNMLVGSAYPVEPAIVHLNSQKPPEEFPPFRDVYQTAVFKACSAIVATRDTNGAGSLEGDPKDLAGGVYIIGRHGPVRLELTGAGPISDGTEHLGWPELKYAVMLMGGLVFACVLAFFAGSNGGIQSRLNAKSRLYSTTIMEAEQAEATRQIPRKWLRNTALAILGIGAGAALLLACTFWTSSHPGEEPWNFGDGTSIWPTEYVRFLGIAGAIFFFIGADVRRQRHRIALWRDFFCENRKEKWVSYYRESKRRWKRQLSPGLRHFFVKQDARRLWNLTGRPQNKAMAHWLQAEVELEQERRANLIKGWMPPFVEIASERKIEAHINAAALFRRYLNLGRFHKRLRRSLAFAVSFMILLLAIISGFQAVPRNLIIRGPASALWDHWMLGVAVAVTLTVIFYMFDAVFLSKRLLDYLSRHPTCWPKPPLLKGAETYGLKPDHLDGVLDMEFAAIQTAEIGPLLFGPLLLVTFLVVARGPWFDAWTWPPGLIAVFVIYYLAVFLCWWRVRRTAEIVRRESRARLQEIRLSVRDADEEFFEVPAPTIADPAAAQPVKRKAYLKNLKKALQGIEEERRGAFARWFQDPTYLAVFIPSGISGILSLISTYWLSK